jgi:hypothetical protein
MPIFECLVSCCGHMIEVRFVPGILLPESASQDHVVAGRHSGRMPGNLTRRERQDTAPARLRARTRGPRLARQPQRSLCEREHYGPAAETYERQV